MHLGPIISILSYPLSKYLSWKANARKLPVHFCWSRTENERIPRKIFVRWQAPPENWVLLSTDGAARGNPAMAGERGVLRGSRGEWVGGCAEHMDGYLLLSGSRTESSPKEAQICYRSWYWKAEDSDGLSGSGGFP